MFAKIFTQIFDSSIAENCRVRHVFEDLLKLADKYGCVDMTMEAVARRTNVPLEEVREGIAALMAPDPGSRSREHEGRRLILMDEAKNWGWEIVNYTKYREIQDCEARRATWRESKARIRGKRKRKWRGKSKEEVKGENLERERRYVEAEEEGDDKRAGEIAAEGLE